jgi:hypothetical protein
MAHKTFLELVNDLATEAGVSGNASSVSAVTGQTGEAARLVKWVKDAHTEIQNKHPNWKWMRSQFTVNTVAGDDSYAPTDCTDSVSSLAIARFKRWWPYDDDGRVNVKRYLTSGGVGGEGFMNYLPWPYFRSIYRLGTQNNGPVTNFTIDPQNNLVLGPKPDGIYTISGEYQKSALVFSADGDLAEFTGSMNVEDFDQLIVYVAMKKYGAFHAAQEVWDRGSIESKRLMRQLEQDQMPEIGLAPPLA